MRPLQILLVEDDHDSAEAIRLLLTLEDFEVGWATCGTDAVRLFRDRVAAGTRPDVVILDLMLPDMDSSALVARLRAIAPVGSIIIHSAASEDQLADAALRIGASSVMRKPTDWGRMLQLLHSIEVAALAS